MLSDIKTWLYLTYFTGRATGAVLDVFDLAATPTFTQMVAVSIAEDKQHVSMNSMWGSRW